MGHQALDMAEAVGWHAPAQGQDDKRNGTMAPLTPREAVLRFMELTGADAEVAFSRLDEADQRSMSLEDAVWDFLASAAPATSEAAAASAVSSAPAAAADVGAAEPGCNGLRGKTLCITGTLWKPRAEVEADVAAAGGKVVKAIGVSGVDYLVSSETGTKKCEEAERRGVVIVSEKWLRERLDAGGAAGPARAGVPGAAPDEPAAKRPKTEGEPRGTGSGAGAAAAVPVAAAGVAAGGAGLGLVVSEAEARAKGDIPDGGETSIEGGSGAYRMTRRGDVYSCSCPAWRNQRLGPYRTCKHIREVRGEEAERKRLVDAGHTAGLEGVRGGGGGGGAKGAAGGAVGSGGKNPNIEKHVMLAHKWQEGKVDPTGYLMSEKLDGMRAIWDGAGLYSRNGNPIAAPAHFLAALPKDVKLDGELFLGRGRFQDVMSVCRSQVPSEVAWREVRYVVFDAPNAKGGIADRLAAAGKAIGDGAADVVRVHPHEVCRGVEHLQEELARVLAFKPPGEGLMLAAPGKPHRGGRCQDILKVKEFHTDDAKVVGYKPGKGRHTGRLGALEGRLRSGARFDIGSGFADAERDNHEERYPLGSIVEFRYFELTEGGIPRFPTFVRARPDVDASEFP